MKHKTLNRLDRIIDIAGYVLFWSIAPAVIALNVALIIACWPA